MAAHEKQHIKPISWILFIHGKSSVVSYNLYPGFFFTDFTILCRDHILKHDSSHHFEKNMTTTLFLVAGIQE